MSEIRAAGVIVFFFALRCIAPLMITVAIGYLMNRLVDRWEAEEAAEAAARQDAPTIIPAAKVVDSTAQNLPCWLIRNCDEKKRARCPAHRETSLPCWFARLMSEGDLPSSCPKCPIYDARLVIS